jgi:dienelactone hydrolase
VSISVIMNKRWKLSVAISVAVLTAAGLTASSASGASGASPARAELTLPAPTGPDAVGTTTLHLIDPARPDPWDVHPGELRQLMVSVFYPAARTAGYGVASQMTSAEADAFDAFNNTGLPAGKVDWAATRTHAYVGAPVAPGRHPVVLYSPGLGDPRGWATTLVEDLASRGYVVVTIDPTYESPAVEFPNGTVAKSVLPPLLGTSDPLPLIRKLITVREADTRFVIGQLGALAAGRDPDAEHRPLPAGLPGALDLADLGMFAQSGGGSVAFQTAFDDPRLKAVINMDGTLAFSPDDGDGSNPLPVAAHGLHTPFLLMGDKVDDHYTQASWSELWSHSRGWHRDLLLRGSQHGSYTDDEALLPQVAKQVSGLPPNAIPEDIGFIDPALAISCEQDYISAFFDTFLRHRPDRPVTCEAAVFIP